MIIAIAAYREKRHRPAEIASHTRVTTNIEFSAFQLWNYLNDNHTEYKRLKDEQNELFMRIKNILYRVNPELWDRYNWYEVEQGRISLAAAYEKGFIEGGKRTVQNQ